MCICKKYILYIETGKSHNFQSNQPKTRENEFHFMLPLLEIKPRTFQSWVYCLAIWAITPLKENKNIYAMVINRLFQVTGGTEWIIIMRLLRTHYWAVLISCFKPVSLTITQVAFLPPTNWKFHLFLHKHYYIFLTNKTVGLSRVQLPVLLSSFLPAGLPYRLGLLPWSQRLWSAVG